MVLTTKIYTIHINKHVLKDQIISKLYVQIHNFTLFQNIILTMTWALKWEHLRWFDLEKTRFCIFAIKHWSICVLPHFLGGSEQTHYDWPNGSLCFLHVCSWPMVHIANSKIYIFGSFCSHVSPKSKTNSRRLFIISDQWDMASMTRVVFIINMSTYLSGVLLMSVWGHILSSDEVTQSQGRFWRYVLFEWWRFSLHGNTYKSHASFTSVYININVYLNVAACIENCIIWRCL